jgi:hypothetical protein
LGTLILVKAETSNQSTRWLFGTTLRQMAPEAGGDWDGKLEKTLKYEEQCEKTDEKIGHGLQFEEL